ncbi:hypothetical protein ERHA55_52640 (plasmid) [Erwinia rhapontici]|nr:hypothetical protein ERHA55_52640 [Erwinia rhapontici]
MDVMGEALDIGREHLFALGEQETELTASQIETMLEKHCTIASGFASKAEELFPDASPLRRCAPYRDVSMTILRACRSSFRLRAGCSAIR